MKHFFVSIIAVVSCNFLFADISIPFSYDHFQSLAKNVGLDGLYETISFSKKKSIISIERYGNGYIFFKQELNNKKENLFFYYYDTISDHPIFEQQYTSNGECIAEIKYKYESGKIIEMLGSYKGHFYELKFKYDIEGRLISEDLINQYNNHTIDNYIYKNNSVYIFSKSGLEKDSTIKKIKSIDSINHVSVNKYFFHGNIDGVDSFFYDHNWRRTRSSYCYLGDVTYKGLIKYVSETYLYYNPEHNFQYFLEEYTSNKEHIDRPKVWEINSISVKIGRPVDRSKLIKRFSGDYSFVSKYDGLFIKDLKKSP